MTKTQENATQENQEVGPFPAGNPKAARNRQDKSITNINKKHKQQKDPQKKLPWNGQQK